MKAIRYPVIESQGVEYLLTDLKIGDYNMKRVVYFMIIITALNISYAQIVSSFSEDEDGWQSDSPSEITWSSIGGNPDGYMRFIDKDSSSSYLFAPEKYLGDWSNLDPNGLLTFDHRIFEFNGTGIWYEVIISGTKGSAMWRGEKVSGVTDWRRQKVPIQESSWKILSGNWKDMLTNITNMKIRIELVDGSPDTEGIDNVVLIPSPTNFCTKFPEGDINLDCKVDLEDFALMAHNWLECGLINQLECYQ